MSRVAGGHHVLGIKHLLGQLGHGQGAVLLAATGRQGSEAGHEEVETGEGYHVDSQFPQVSVELAGESEAGGDTGHGGGDEMVQVTVCRGGQFERTEADIVQCFIVYAIGLVGVFDQLMNRQGGVVWLYNCVGDLKIESKI